MGEGGPPRAEDGRCVWRTGEGSFVVWGGNGLKQGKGAGGRQGLSGDRRRPLESQRGCPAPAQSPSLQPETHPRPCTATTPALPMQAPAFSCTCNICQREIAAGEGYRCTVCTDFDMCNECYRKPTVSYVERCVLGFRGGKGGGRPRAPGSLVPGAGCRGRTSCPRGRARFAPRVFLRTECSGDPPASRGLRAILMRRPCRRAPTRIRTRALLGVGPCPTLLQAPARA